MTERLFNFNAGPAVLPVEVLETVRDNVLNYKSTGIGLLEMSHRSADFDEILNTALSDLRELLGVSDDYAIIFTTGGATNHFSMVPMNLLSPNTTADYVVGGFWAKKAAQEAKKFGEVNIAASSQDKNFSYIPKQLSLSENSAYVHITSNNTIVGSEYHEEPQIGGRVLVCDASSDFLHKKVDVSKYGLIYAGAQKNLGPAGVTLVIIRKDLLKRIPDGLPIMQDYRTYADSNSLYNTPPVVNIYVVAEVFKWLKRIGGLDAIEKRNREKAEILYQALDQSSFYKAVVAKEDRSLMNVTFRLPTEQLEEDFAKQAKKEGFIGLKGHRSVGGIRASIYNAFPKEGVVALVSFMKEFERTQG